MNSGSWWVSWFNALNLLFENRTHHVFDNYRTYRSSTGQQCWSFTILVNDVTNIVTNWTLSYSLKTLKFHILLQMKMEVNFCKKTLTEYLKIMLFELIFNIGLLFDPKATFNLHTESIINKARSRIAFIFHFSKNIKNWYSVILLYCNFVQPILEYCNCGWWTRYGVHMARIKSVQTRFLFYFLGYFDWIFVFLIRSHIDRLKLIDWIVWFKWY